MSNSQDNNVSNGEVEKKQETAPVSEAAKVGTATGESVVQEVSSNLVSKEAARGSELELPEKTNPTAGREASYVYDVLNMPSTVDTTGMRPNPNFEVKQSTFGQDLQEQSKSADELVARKESSAMYKDELAKIEMMVKGKGMFSTNNTIVPPRSEKDGSEFRLSENPGKANLFPSSWQWIPAASPETLQQNLSAISERKDGAVRVANESIILNTGSDFSFFRERRLFANKHNIFFLGKHKRALVMVKKINSTGHVTNNPSDPLWVSIVKRISYTQQLEVDKAIAKAQTMAKESSGGESTAASITFTDEHDLSSVGTSSNGAEKTLSMTVRVARPFLQVYEIFRIETDRSLMLFMEIASKKSLHYHVKQRTAVDVAQARLWSAQVLDGLTYLANHGVAHRAIRLEHILIDGQENARLIGWRRALPLSALTRRERRLRPNNHLPPEAFLGSYEPSTVDLWSWGVVLCALATFRYPFNVRSQRAGGVEEEWATFKARHPASGHPQVTALLDTLFLNDPEKRATLPTIQSNVWFARSVPPQTDNQPQV